MTQPDGIAEVGHPAEQPTIAPRAEERAFDVPRAARIMAGTFLALSLIINFASALIEKFLLEPFIASQFFWVAGMAYLLGEFGALALVLVWTNGPFLWRLGIVWALSLVLWGAWFAGYWLTLDHDSVFGVEIYLRIATDSLISLPLVSLAMQLPHWAFRVYLGWRVVAPAAEAQDRRINALAIRDILIGTTIVALTIVPFRLFAREPGAMNAENWFGLGITALVLSAVSLLFLVPLVVLVLKMRRVGPAIGFLLLAPLGGLLVFVVVMLILSRGRIGSDFGELPLLFVGMATCLATCSIPLWIARFAGYHLVMGRAVSSAGTTSDNSLGESA
jgi:hypothetical protein